MRPAEFAVEVKKRLRVDLYPRGGFCPFCHETLDVKGDHALLCAAGGDRTIRHHAMRNLFAHLCDGAGLRADLEPEHVLIPDSDHPAHLPW